MRSGKVWLKTALTVMITLMASVSVAAGEKVVVYMDPDCGWCGKWADHMRENGFAVQEVKTRQMALIKNEAGVPPALGSCHTAQVGGYVVEGHVPASDVRRMLDEKPALTGISAPGMPLGSPGMEGPYPAEPYEVVGFDAEGSASVYSRH